MVNTDVARIVLGAVDDDDCNCLAILRNGNRITKAIAVRFPNDVLADLPSVAANVIIVI